MGGGGGKWMETEVRLSTGAFEAMWREHGLRPVLQLADEPRMAGGTAADAEAGPYRFSLSDGGDHLQPGVLAASLNHLVARGALRCGTVIRVLEYFAGFFHNQRVIIVIQLEILHAECTLVCSPTIFEANASQHIVVSCSGGPAIHEPCFMPCTQQVVSNSSSSPDKRVLDSSVTPKAEPTVFYLPFSETTQCTVDAKMEQLSLNDHQNQRFLVTATGDFFGPPGNSYASAMLASYLQDPPGLSGAMAAWLTPGAVVAVSEHGDGNGTLQPVLQVLDIRMVSNTKNPSTERFQMVLSDGIYTMQSMLATSLNSFLLDGSIKNGSIIHLQEFTCSTNQFHRIIIVTKLYVLQSECNIMGNPKPYEMRNQPNEQVTILLANAAQANTVITPVSALNPYQNIWTIKARVTAKTGFKRYNNAKGPGKVFSFDLLDGQGGEIRVTCFNAQADEFFDLIEVDKVYLISSGSLKKAEKKFNSLNHEYEITLGFKSCIELCTDGDSKIPRQQYNFRQISEIECIEANGLVDLIGIVTSVGPSATISRKDGSEVQKKTLQLKDMSCRSVEITLWGKFCDAEGQQLQMQCDSGLNPVLALKGARITEFNGRSVSSIGSTQLKIDPDFPEAESLRRWYATQGKSAACVSLSSFASVGRSDVRKAVSQIKDEGLMSGKQYLRSRMKGAISHIVTENFCYPACTVKVNGRQCLKKVINNGDGTWHCDKCDQSVPDCEYRYVMQFQIQDHTGVTYATAFQEAGIEMVGHSAHELYNIREEDTERFAEIIQGLRWQQFLFKLKVYDNDEHRIKCNMMRAEKLDPALESSYLVGGINGLLQDDTGSPSEAQGGMAYNAGISNTGAGRSAPTSNSAYTTNMSGRRYGESANQLALQGNMYVGASTPLSAIGNVQTCMSCGSSGHNAQNCPAGMYRQQTAASTASSYGSSQARNVGPCFKCNQPGFFANSCPLLAPAPQQQQQYRSGSVLSGGYGQQPILGLPTTESQ